MNVKKIAFFIALWFSSASQAIEFNFMVDAPDDGLLMCLEPPGFEEPEFEFSECGSTSSICRSKKTKGTPKSFSFLCSGIIGMVDISSYDIKAGNQLDPIGSSTVVWGDSDDYLYIYCKKPSKSLEQVFKITRDNGKEIFSCVCNNKNYEEPPESLPNGATFGFDFHEYERVTITVRAKYKTPSHDEH